MKKITLTKIVEMWSEQCIYCGKLIEGYTPTQVLQLMKVHHTSKVCKLKQEEQE